MPVTWWSYLLKVLGSAPGRDYRIHTFIADSYYSIKLFKIKTGSLGAEFVVPFSSHSQIASKKSSNDNLFFSKLKSFHSNDDDFTQTLFLYKKFVIY